jgi:hypothetical protein
VRVVRSLLHLLTLDLQLLQMLAKDLLDLEAGCRGRLVASQA